MVALLVEAATAIAESLAREGGYPPPVLTPEQHRELVEACERCIDEALVMVKNEIDALDEAGVRAWIRREFEPIFRRRVGLMTGARKHRRRRCAW